RALRDEDRGLVFISHRFEEIFELCDTVTVLRDGSYIDTTPIKDTSSDALVTQMVGREVNELFPKIETTPRDVVLEVENLTQTGMFNDISFNVRGGAWRSEVARAIFGVDPYESGTIKLFGRKLPKQQPRAAMAAGVALVPEDRRNQGLVIDATVRHNVTEAIRRRLTKLGLLFAS